MKPLLLLALIVVSGLPQIYGSLTQFAEMIKSKTGKNALASYGAYGCHCGVDGKGTPKDATDRCCLKHDCCYKRLVNRKCGTKLLKYDFTIKGSSITCKANQGSCQKQLCECDKAAASCFAQNLKSYNKKYQFYPNLMCHGKAPSC
ncbi:Phospholipase A2, membrane associated [Heterocephalus glaber]|uniref:Phospholipase A2 n=1 Tax=Heterocephalus glaber TaxID=10181 RepID=G5BZK5_HETGA|nr:phospholipase A2, membrane associated [Heterocephalus glaber]EHB14716.1 Phospholipase A2, membrane associated [Heterocephalus glaber]